ncbi:MAG: hypothetical protein SNJ67_01495 [Chloracidobacterium sp.]|uniref:Uncharacterized protein n=1 Tax=Chloracidobacterium validum TaxID=2821543 RepID=A0ABX8B7X4_9BACT|nr:hypothetical protein [Chloracidobacterium validum]QUW02761.1 hypothetical protein J8C06_10555 [Chloracidobacterium validum]
MTPGLSIRPHSSSDYRALPKQMRWISETDQGFVDGIGAILVEHGMQERFAVSFLHRHFEYYDDELCFVTFDPGERSLTISPMPCCNLDGQSITAISCRFVEGSGDDPLNLIGLEYASLSDLGDVAPISEHDSDCLRAIYRFLVRNNVVNMFGLSLRYVDTHENDDLDWMEDSFPEHRISVRKLMNCHQLSNEHFGASVWVWSAGRSARAAIGCTETGMTQDPEPDDGRLTPKVYCDRGRFHDPDPQDDSDDSKHQEQGDESSSQG